MLLCDINTDIYDRFESGARCFGALPDRAPNGPLTVTAATVLVTGARGFVGAALVHRLGREGRFQVRGTSRNAPTGEASGIEYRRVGDLAGDTDWSGAFDGVGTVVHLAARVHVMQDQAADPLGAFRRANTAGTEALARQAARAGVRRFIFLSSIKVNGEGTTAGRAFTEADLPAPADPYSRSKAEAEAGLMAVASSTGMEVVVIRPPLVYGPGVKANFLSMVRWLARGVPLPLGAITDNRRTLIGLDNLVDLILTCAMHPAAANQVFVAGDGESLSTTGLLRRTAAALGVQARLVPVPVALLKAGAALLGRRDMVQRLCESLEVDTSKARRVLGWSPPFTVDEGLRRAVAI
ncbi:MAG: SDR family oxidoreductase [Gemmatimonadetes bacterium]|nr:SDR family oxidoreductase [Gemmatimonadota bacterium]